MLGRFRGVALAVVVGWVCVPAARAEVLIFLDDFEGFMEAAGEVQVIDFDTLPDGSPSVGGTLITPDFNYTDQGVTFTVPLPSLYIVGSAPGYFTLMAAEDNDMDPTAIISDLVTPARAVGVDFGGHTTVSAYDEGGKLIVSQYLGGPGPHFLGFVSDIPIAHTVQTRYIPAEYIRDFYFTPVPEPVSGLMLAFATVGLLARRRRRMGDGAEQGVCGASGKERLS